MKSLVNIAGILAASSIALAHDGDENESHHGSATAPPDTGATVTTIVFPGGNGSSPPKPTQTGCPTVTVTGELCTTCPIPLCLGLATATQRCGCPETISTVTLNFPCENKCSGVFCSTTWMYETEMCTSTPTSGMPTSSPTSSGQEGGEGGPNGGGDGSSTSSSSTGPTTVSANFGNRLAPFWVGLI